MAPTKTKPKREAAYGEPPAPTAWKDKKVTIEYEARAKAAIRAALAESGLSYEQLAARLRKKGIEISDKGVENKIARGSFSAAFLIQCLDAVGVKSLDLPG
jgi:ribosome-binding protein aMBF1 (putative translation factor)